MTIFAFGYDTAGEAEETSSTGGKEKGLCHIRYDFAGANINVVKDNTKSFFSCAVYRSRTCNRQSRNLMLYPFELKRHLSPERDSNPRMSVLRTGTFTASPPGQMLRKQNDSNVRDGRPSSTLAGCRHRPLGHTSISGIAGIEPTTEACWAAALPPSYIPDI